MGTCECIKRWSSECERLGIELSGIDLKKIRHPPSTYMGANVFDSKEDADNYHMSDADVENYNHAISKNTKGFEIAKRFLAHKKPKNIKGICTECGLPLEKNMIYTFGAVKPRSYS